MIANLEGLKNFTAMSQLGATELLVTLESISAAVQFIPSSEKQPAQSDRNRKKGANPPANVGG